MAFTIWRFGRFLQSICVPTTCIIAFSFLLTWVFVLYQPTDGPGRIQRMGWQSWDTVLLGLENVNHGSEQQSLPPQDSDDDAPTVPSAGVDWWNVTQDATSSADTTSLPLDVWSPLLPHDTGLTELAIERCLVNPDLAADICMPHTTKEDDAMKGKWVRITRNLNIQKGYWHLNVLYRRTRRQDVPLITDVQLLAEDEDPYPKSDDWHKVSTSIRDGVPGQPKLFLWYKTGKTRAEMDNAEKKNGYIMELDVLYGEDRPWYGFERMGKPISDEQEGKAESVWLSYRKGVKIAPKAPPLHFSHTGRFKILQIADLHFSVSFGTCRDVGFECKHSDNTTRTLISHVLEAEKPDLVVFTGDQLNGQGTSWDPRSVLAKFAIEVTDAGIPWAAVFGNHDEEDVDLKKNGKEEQVKMMQALPYSLIQRGPKDVHGVGNYVLKVMSPDASKTHLLTLYFLDSGSYSKGILDWFGFFKPTEYDYIREDQINWFLQESSRINAIERPFTPDGGKDFGSIWSRQSDQVTPQLTKLAKPNALMFFHIPLQEAYGAADYDSKTGNDLNVGIHDLDGNGSAKQNAGFFEKGVLKALESSHVSAKSIPEVKAIGNGHCHLTENCKRVKGVWMCFGGGGSYSGYGKVGFDRRFRIYDISDYGETIRTYKRTEKDQIMDDMVLAGAGAPALRR